VRRAGESGGVVCGVVVPEREARSGAIGGQGRPEDHNKRFKNRAQNLNERRQQEGTLGGNCAFGNQEVRKKHAISLNLPRTEIGETDQFETESAMNAATAVSAVLGSRESSQ